MEDEVWREIPGFEGLYDVSSRGLVRSRDHMVNFNGGTRIMKGRVIKPMFSHGGYHQVNLYRGRKCITTKVHRCVAMAFIPNPLGYDQVNHKDFDRTNNDVCNLEWCSAKLNTAHNVEAGRIIKGEDKILAKLKESDVVEIRKLHSENMRSYRVKRGFMQELANRYNVSTSLVEKVVRRVNWKHI